MNTLSSTCGIAVRLIAVAFVFSIGCVTKDNSPPANAPGTPSHDLQPVLEKNAAGLDAAGETPATDLAKQPDKPRDDVKTHEGTTTNPTNPPPPKP